MFLDTGEKSLHPVVCLHSLFLDPMMFDELVEAGRGQFRFIRPEFPGQGSTVKNASSIITMSKCADGIVTLLDSLKVKTFSLIGQSMGGDVAVRVADLVGNRLQSIIFSGSSVCSETPENLEQFRPVSDEVQRRGFDDELTDIVMHIMFGATTLAAPEKSNFVALWRQRISALDANLHWAIRGVVEREDATHLLSNISVPAFIINGVEDIARPDAWSADMAAHLKKSERLRIENAGHSALLETPDVVIPRILEFLEHNT